ncbi:MAG: M15 family metallopeptidase [Velocimicrobium sp.]
MKSGAWKNLKIALLFILIGSVAAFLGSHNFYEKEETTALESINETEPVIARNAGEEKKKDALPKQQKPIKGQKVFEVLDISNSIFLRIKDKSYKENCDIPLEELKYLKVSYYGFDGKPHVGEIIVNKAIAEDTIHIFQDLYDVKYPIEKIKLVDEYDADDNASMEDNNTSAFNFRYIEGTNTESNHARGFAIDINPLYNPYVRVVNGTETVLPVTAKVYADRTRECAYFIKKDDICEQIFEKYGFTWGGEWTTKKDYQHFEKQVKDERN